MIPADPSALPAATGYNRLRQTRHGLMLYNINDQYVGRSLDLYGEFSEEEVRFFQSVVRRGDIVLEVGANLGAHTVPLANAAGAEGMIVALEPQRLVFQTLCANVALNSLVNVRCLQLAAGEEAGTIDVPCLDPNRAQNFGGLSLELGAPGEPVSAIRLDSIPLPRLRLVKLDVEGMELAALRGASGLIEKYRPAMYVENDRPDKSADLIRHIDSLGYAMYWHFPPLFNRNNFLKYGQNVFGEVVSQNMICVPREQPAEIQGLRPVEVPSPILSK